MIGWLKDFLWNETTFARSMRSLLLFGGAILASGAVYATDAGEYHINHTKLMGAVAMASAGMIAAGEKNSTAKE